MKTDGTLWAWGAGGHGRLGVNANAQRSSPTQIPGTWSSFSSSSYQGFGIKTGGTLWSWGYNKYGALGQNNVTYYSSPVQIPGTDWDKVACGPENNFGFKSV